ncbi:hypothetical protein NEOKW01_0618 [Nematocida sp. AWRm80]|nr:hypothetical protein NEOKW01_0618 [Nematocida sp. AWRm80]
MYTSIYCKNDKNNLFGEYKYTDKNTQGSIVVQTREHLTTKHSGVKVYNLEKHQMTVITEGSKGNKGNKESKEKEEYSINEIEDIFGSNRNKYKIDTTGVLDISIKDTTVYTSNTNGIFVYSDLLNNGITEYSKYYEIGTSYKHNIHENSLVSGSSNGIYHRIDLSKGIIEKMNHTHYTTENSSNEIDRCIYDIFTVYNDDRIECIGCDIGILTMIDRRTDRIINRISCDSGITTVNRLEDKIEIGTYKGEYILIDDNYSIIHRTNTNSIIWRIETVSIQGTKYKVVAQSYDGIGIYTNEMISIHTIQTEDIIYTIRIEGEGSNTLVVGYGYYKDILILCNLWEIIQKNR